MNNKAILHFLLDLSEAYADPIEWIKLADIIYKSGDHQIPIELLEKQSGQMRKVEEGFEEKTSCICALARNSVEGSRFLSFIIQDLLQKISSIKVNNKVFIMSIKLLVSFPSKEETNMFWESNRNLVEYFLFREIYFDYHNAPILPLSDIQLSSLLSLWCDLLNEHSNSRNIECMFIYLVQDLFAVVNTLGSKAVISRLQIISSGVSRLKKSYKIENPSLINWIFDFIIQFNNIFSFQNEQERSLFDFKCISAFNVSYIVHPIDCAMVCLLIDQLQNTPQGVKKLLTFIDRQSQDLDCYPNRNNHLISLYLYAAKRGTNSQEVNYFLSKMFSIFQNNKRETALFENNERVFIEVLKRDDIIFSDGLAFVGKFMYISKCSVFKREMLEVLLQKILKQSTMDIEDCNSLLKMFDDPFVSINIRTNILYCYKLLIQLSHKPFELGDIFQLYDPKKGPEDSSILRSYERHFAKIYTIFGVPSVKHVPYNLKNRISVMCTAVLRLVDFKRRIQIKITKDQLPINFFKRKLLEAVIRDHKKFTSTSSLARGVKIDMDKLMSIVRIKGDESDKEEPYLVITKRGQLQIEDQFQP